MRLVKKIIDTTRRTNLWIRAVKALENGRTGEAISNIEQMEEIAPLMPHHLALLGSAHVLSHDSRKARKEFVKAEELTNKKEDADSRYINAYARVFLRLMDTSEPVDEVIAEADSIDCSASLKRCLPLKPIKRC